VTNTGKAYEALTEQVFSRLMAQSNVCVKVERDIVLTGKSTSHQIDVTFEFVMGATSYRTIVQCKDWASAVKQEQVLAFHDVLGDIPGQPRGIMVARSGFQDGARKVAAHHGIQLYELREPRDEDWDGLIRTIEITGILRIPDFENVRLVLDQAWGKEQLARLKLARLDVDFEFQPRRQPLRCVSGATCDLDAILNNYVPHEVCEGLQVRHEFTDPPLLPVPDGPLPEVRVSAMDATIRVTEDRRVYRVSLDHLVAYAFRDVLAGNVEFLRADGQKIGPE
jgi:Restriction endonuclease